MMTSEQFSRAQCDTWHSYIVAVHENAEMQAKMLNRVSIAILLSWLCAQSHVVATHTTKHELRPNWSHCLCLSCNVSVVQVNCVVYPTITIWMLLSFGVTGLKEFCVYDGFGAGDLPVCIWLQSWRFGLSIPA